MLGRLQSISIKPTNLVVGAHFFFGTSCMHAHKILLPYKSRKRHEQVAEFILAWHIPLAEELNAYNEAIRHRNTLTS